MGSLESDHLLQAQTSAPVCDSSCCGRSAPDQALLEAPDSASFLPFCSFLSMFCSFVLHIVCRGNGHAVDRCQCSPNHSTSHPGGPVQTSKQAVSAGRWGAFLSALVCLYRKRLAVDIAVDIRVSIGTSALVCIARPTHAHAVRLRSNPFTPCLCVGWPDGLFDRLSPPSGRFLTTQLSRRQP
ncbi:hypothetical protein J3E69DRAFT_207002 [Trichoderma sp. SZMC 28015]